MNCSNRMGVTAVFLILLWVRATFSQNTADSAKQEIAVPAENIQPPSVVAAQETDVPDGAPMAPPAVDTTAVQSAADSAVAPASAVGTPDQTPHSAAVSAGIVINDTLASLDKMVVSATRTRRRISETPASVSIISRNEIELSPAKDINDLIANKASVQVRRYVGMGEGVPSDIIMRGIPGALAATRTLILVDGIPTNASGTPFLILNEIPVEIIDNIEIVRGPYSSLYGANAFGGVINVMTRKGEGRPGAAGTFETSYPFSAAHDAWSKNNPIREAAAAGTRQALWNGDVLSSGGNAKFDYLVNGGYRTIGNYLLSDSALVAKVDTAYKIPARNYDYGDWRLFGRFGWRTNDRLFIELHTRYFKSDLGFGYTRYCAPDTIDIDIKGEKIIAGPQIRWKVNDRLDLRAGGYVRHVLGYYSNEMDKQPIEWKSSARDWQIDFQGVLRSGNRHVLTWGAELLSNTINFGDIVNMLSKYSLEGGVTDRIRNGGAYVQDEFTLMERLHVVPGVRLDYHTEFGFAVSPKLGVSALLTERVRLRSSLGRAFRAPNHTELFMPPLPLKDTITLVSNRNLKPEYVWAFDGGADFTPRANCKITLGVFYNSMKNLIGQGIKIGNNAGLYVTHDNIGSAWSAGSELEIDWRIIPEVRIAGSYVFQQSRNESASEMAAYFKRKLKERSGVDKTDIQLDYIPAHKGGVGVTYTKKMGRTAWSVSADELLVGERTCQRFENIRFGTGDPIEVFLDLSDNTIKANPPVARLPMYARTDFSLRCDIGSRFWVSLCVQNCFDAEYEESFGTLVPRRLASIKAGAAF